MDKQYPIEKVRKVALSRLLGGMEKGELLNELKTQLNTVDAQGVLDAAVSDYEAKELRTIAGPRARRSSCLAYQIEMELWEFFWEFSGSFCGRRILPAFRMWRHLKCCATFLWAILGLGERLLNSFTASFFGRIRSARILSPEGIKQSPHYPCDFQCADDSILSSIYLCPHINIHR